MGKSNIARWKKDPKKGWQLLVTFYRDWEVKRGEGLGDFHKVIIHSSNSGPAGQPARVKLTSRVFGSRDGKLMAYAEEA